MKKKVLILPVIMMFISVVSKVLGFLREVLIAQTYGASFVSDSYVFINGIISLLFINVTNAITTIFIPMLSEKINYDNKDEQNKFINNILTVITIISIALTFIGIIGSKYIIKIFAPGFYNQYNATQIDNINYLLKISMISLVFIIIQYLFIGVLQVYKKFLIANILPVLGNVVIILYIVFLGNKNQANGLVYTLVLSYVFQFLVCYIAYKSIGYKYKPYFNMSESYIKQIGKLIIPVFIGTSLTQLNFLVDRIIASGFEAGSLAILNFGNKLTNLIYAVVGMTIGTIIFPYLSEFSMEKNKKKFISLVEFGINITYILIIPLSVFMIFFRMEIVNLVFLRGEFNIEEAKSTAQVVLYYSIGILAFSLKDLLNKVYYSFKNTRTPMINSFIGITINILLNIILSKSMGLNGLALSASIANIIIVLLLITNLSKKIKMNYKTMMYKFIVCILTSVTISLSLSLFKHYLLNLGNSKLLSLLSLSVLIILNLILYFIVIFKSKIINIKYLHKLIK